MRRTAPLLLRPLLSLLLLAACATSPGTPVEIQDRPVALALRLEGAAGAPRGGALLGLPGGLSFEYAPGTLQLVAVRRGDFARERDGVLTPTGELVLDRREEAATPLASLADGDALEARLEGVWVRDVPSPVDPRVRRPTPGLSYALVDAKGVVRARVEESVRATPQEDGWGFVRSFLVRPGPYPCELTFDLVRPMGDLDPDGVVTRGNPRDADWSLEAGGRVVSAVHRAKPTLHQRLTKSLPRGVRHDEQRVHVDLDRSPLRFELAEQYVDGWGEDSPAALDAALRR